MVRRSLYRALWCTRILTVTQDKNRDNVRLGTVMSGLRSRGNVHIFIGCGAVLLLLCLPCRILILTVLIVKVQYKQKVGSGNSEKATVSKCPSQYAEGRRAFVSGPTVTMKEGQWVPEQLQPQAQTITRSTGKESGAATFRWLFTTPPMPPRLPEEGLRCGCLNHWLTLKELHACVLNEYRERQKQTGGQERGKKERPSKGNWENEEGKPRLCAAHNRNTFTARRFTCELNNTS